MRPKRPTFASEAELCRAFIRAVNERGGWSCYPETGGWDILMVRTCDGMQVGIQAKLRLNAKVVSQALGHWLDDVTGPDFRAVLVPVAGAGGMSTICSRLGVTVITVTPPSPGAVRVPFSPWLPDNRWAWNDRYWHPWCPVKRVKLPGYIPDVTAGASAPRQLTDWKVKAIKLAILLEDRPVTRADFKALGLSPTRWTDRFHGWLVATPRGYVPTRRMPRFAKDHPVNYAQIKADMPLWGKDLMPVTGMARLL